MALISIDEALAAIAAEVTPLPDVEAVELGDARGRVLAEELRAGADLPSFASSAMDGFALRAEDTPGALELIGESAAGAPFPGALRPGTAVTISTGAVVPDGADAVLPVELSRVDAGRLHVADPVPGGDNVRPRGSDVVRGQTLLAAGTRIGPAQIGAAAAVGLRALPCRRAPRVAVMSTGTELRAPGEPLGPGEIYDSNSPMLGAALASATAETVVVPAVADDPQAHRAALARALEYDVVITSGGVSVGAHDLVRASAAELGVREVFWRVALRPGKPLSFGVHGATLVFGLPGNPVSSLVCFELFVRPALLALQGAPFSPGFRHGILAAPALRNEERDELIRVNIATSEDGSPALTPLTGQGSHQIAVTAGADGLARIPSGSGELAAGSGVTFLPLA